MVGGADEQQARQTADAAGEQHGADDDLVHLDAHVPRGALGLADDGDLIAVLGVVQIDVHRHAQHRDDEDVQQVALSADDRQPAQLGLLVDDADLARALGGLPHHAEEGDQLGGDVVHHQREQRLVGVPLGLEEGGDAAPDGPGQDAGDDHAEDDGPVGEHVAQHYHARRRRETARQGLALAAHVPEAHPERRGDGQRYAQQYGHVLEGHPDLSGGAEGAVDDGGVDGDGVLTCDEHGDQRAHDQR